MSMLVARRSLASFLVAVFGATLVAQAQPPGGFSGGYRPDPNEIVDRMDENKNGQIDPDEMQGRARFFLEGLARDNGLDLNKPIGKDKLRDMLKARFGGSSSGGSSSGSSSSSRDGDRYRSSQMKEPAPAIVQGFGVAAAPDATAKVPGFGPPPSAESWDVLKQKYNGRVIDEVEEALDRSDRDRDGFLDREEVKNGRFRGDPMEYDKNKDGKLSRSELAVRYQERESGGGSSGGSSGGSGGSSNYGGYGGGYGGGPPGGFGGGPPGGFSGGYGFRGPPPGGSSSSGGPSSSSGSGSSSSSSRGPTSSGSSSTGSTSTGSSSSGSSSGGSSSTSSSGDDRIARYAEGLLNQYDANKDGKLQKSEWSNMRGEPQKADRNGDEIITKDELAAQLGSFGKGSSSGSSSPGTSTSSSGGSSSGSGSSRSYGSSRGSSSSKTASKSGDRKTYRFLAATERLPQGLPDWFASNDADADGQIAMSEFSKSWDDAKAKEFAQWDKNGDGLITAGECLKKAE